MLAAVGGLASVLVAFTLLQIIAPGLEKSIETFNEYLKPVEAPKCLGTEEGCLEAKGEGGIVSFSGDSLTEGVEDIPPTSTGNGGRPLLQKIQLKRLSLQPQEMRKTQRRLRRLKRSAKEITTAPYLQPLKLILLLTARPFAEGGPQRWRMFVLVRLMYPWVLLCKRS